MFHVEHFVDLHTNRQLTADSADLFYSTVTDFARFLG